MPQVFAPYCTRAVFWTEDTAYPVPEPVPVEGISVPCHLAHPVYSVYKPYPAYLPESANPLAAKYYLLHPYCDKDRAEDTFHLFLASMHAVG